MNQQASESLTVCQTCGFPHYGEACTNPACFANPTITEEQKAAWRAATEKRAAEDAERKRIRRLREKSFGSFGGSF